MFENVFFEIAALLLASACVGAIAVWLRQPLIIAFIAVSILVGPAGFGWVAAADEIDLGAQLNLDVLGAMVGPAMLLSLFVLIGNPVIVMAIMGAMGHRKRTSFLAGLTVAQISEFSLILTVFERRVPRAEQAVDIGWNQQTPDAILSGVGRNGGHIAHRLSKNG